jgi:hypothetical protein
MTKLSSNCHLSERIAAPHIPGGLSGSTSRRWVWYTAARNRCHLAGLGEPNFEGSSLLCGS